MDKRTRSLLEAPIGRTLLRLAAPNVAVMVFQSLVGVIETYFVAKLGTDSLAGMALVFPILMQVQMMSAGAMGGGILSAVARHLGAGRTDEASTVAWHAVAISLGLGILTTGLALGFGTPLYRLMGGSGASLAAAETYSGIVFAGAVIIWLFNALAAVIRGTGNMAIPAIVSMAGAVVLIPVSPALILGWGGLPRLGIAGGGVAVLGYYTVGSLVYAWYLWSGRSVLRPSFTVPRLKWAQSWDILRIGFSASLISITTNVTIATVTGLVGHFGPGAVAGYGTGARIEYLLVPIVFGLGAPLAAMVGTSIGAGQPRRALRVAWTGAIIAFVITEAIGITVACFPQAWLRLYGDDPQMLAIGSQYLHIAGPFYGLFGLGMALYFASQGAGRLFWPMVGGFVRLVVAAGGGLLWIHLGGGFGGVFLLVGLAMIAMGGVIGIAVASGVWFRGRTPPQPSGAMAQKPAS